MRAAGARHCLCIKLKTGQRSLYRILYWTTYAVSGTRRQNAAFPINGLFKERALSRLKTKRQEELLNTFLSEFDDESRPLYQDMAAYLSELGYYPRKQRSYIVFRHDSHNREMAKMGVTWTKDHSPYFALRFSACKGYSQRFAEIIGDFIRKNPERLFPHCENGNCVFNAEGDKPPVYQYVFPDGTVKALCGAKALVIPDITKDDIDEIKKLIKEEHAYLMLREAGVSVI
ncbi:MAG: hypothetical protein LBH95_05055 [Oscillospiraceae bacterium]|jgi:hypothetical protein|nr:hypothetical protein [Oscillospiraceae bacterium]